MEMLGPPGPSLGTTYQGDVRMSTRPRRPPERYFLDRIG